MLKLCVVYLLGELSLHPTGPTFPTWLSRGADIPHHTPHHPYAPSKSEPLAPRPPATMPTNPNSQYLSTVLNHPATIPSHAAPAQTTPHGSTPPRPRQPSTQLQPGAASAHAAPFTAAQRSAQARGKPFDTPGASGRARATSPESFASRQRRDEAAAILDSQEMLLWFSAARNESVAQTRRFYRDIVLGVPRPDAVWSEEWERGPEEGKSPGGKGRERERGVGRKRVSGGGPHGGFGEGS